MEETDRKLTAAAKNINPVNAIGNLFNAPTIETVVDDVTLTYHAEQYEMPTKDAPDKIIAEIATNFSSWGKFNDWKTFRTPIFD